MIALYNKKAFEKLMHFHQANKIMFDKCFLSFRFLIKTGF